MSQLRKRFQRTLCQSDHHPWFFFKIFTKSERSWYLLNSILEVHHHDQLLLVLGIKRLSLKNSHNRLDVARGTTGPGYWNWNLNYLIIYKFQFDEHALHCSWISLDFNGDNQTDNHHLHINRRNGNVSDNSELTAVVQMLVLQTEKVPDKPEDDSDDGDDDDKMTVMMMTMRMKMMKMNDQKLTFWRLLQFVEHCWSSREGVQLSGI